MGTMQAIVGRWIVMVQYDWYRMGCWVADFVLQESRSNLASALPMGI